MAGPLFSSELGPADGGGRRGKPRAATPEYADGQAEPTARNR